MTDAFKEHILETIESLCKQLDSDLRLFGTALMRWKIERGNVFYERLDPKEVRMNVNQATKKVTYIVHNYYRTDKDAEFSQDEIMVVRT